MIDDVIKRVLVKTLGCGTAERASPPSKSALNETRVYKTDKGQFFVKLNHANFLTMYEAEAKGLQVLAQTKTLRVPIPYHYGKSRDTSFLIMENIEMHPHSYESQTDLGVKLANMHLSQAPEEFGFDFNNTIGTTPQINTWTSDWVHFFSQHRLRYQLGMIETHYADTQLRKDGEKLITMLPEFFKGIEVKPSLLHGDLWSGNTAADTEGRPTVYDPAPYFGHDEADLSIMDMFGGFSTQFYEAYHDKIPRRDGFEERTKIYKLYHYLNHYNLFGSSYRSACVSILHSLN